MTKIGKNFTVELDDWARFDTICKEKKVVPSKALQQFIRGYIIDYESQQYKLIKCINCGSEYSTKFSECPKCKSKEAIEEIKTKEEQEKDRQKRIEEQKERNAKTERLIKERAEIVKWLQSANETIHRLDKEKRIEDKTRIEVEKADKEVRIQEIDKTLSDLNDPI